MQLGAANLKMIVFAAILGFAIPVSTAGLDIAATALILLCFFDKASFANIKLALQEPMVKAALLVYLFFLLGVGWSHAPRHDIIHMLLKMDIFLLLPFYFAIFYNAQYKKAVFYGFVIASVLAVILSLTSHVLHSNFYQNDGMHFFLWGHDFHTFRGHTYQNYFNALMVVGLLTVLMYQDTTKAQKLIFTLIIALATIDIMFVEYGRTGQILFVIMLVMFFVFWRLKIGLIISGILIFILMPLTIYSSTTLQNSIAKARLDMSQYDKGDAVTSIGARMVFHKNSEILIKQAPVLGHGTGSYNSEYLELHSTVLSTNPHNDYLWFGVELGVLGIFCLCFFILVTLYQSYLTEVPYSYLGIILTTTYAISCFQNSFFTDRITGQAFMVLTSCLFARAKKST